jgi:hypothetical protein
MQQQMRISEAILLGSTYINPVPYTTDNNGGGGCALGMAIIATGSMNLAEFPWLREPCKAPCGCDSIRYPANDPAGRHTYPITCYAEAIAHLFNEHVMEHECTGKAAWTLEQLVDWVRTVEPKEGEVMQHQGTTVTGLMGLVEKHDGLFECNGCGRYNALQVRTAGELTINYVESDVLPKSRFCSTECRYSAELAAEDARRSDQIVR